MEWSDVEWGTVAEWVGALGTIGALIAAVAVFRKELDSLHAERESRSEERELRRKEHARTVAVWVDDREAFIAEGVAPTYETTMHVKNASSWPVHNCVAYLIHPIAGPADDPAHPDHLAASELVIGAVPPGETVSEVVD